MAEIDSSDASERYEFDAPSHVVDLKELQNADNDDKWFGESLEPDSYLRLNRKSKQCINLHTLFFALYILQLVANLNALA